MKSQAIELLAVPSDEREKFAEEIGAKDMTITELREEIKAMKESKTAAEAEISKLKAEQETAAKENEALIGDIESLSECYCHCIHKSKKSETMKCIDIIGNLQYNKHIRV